jgi:hypothetical protein
MIFNIATFTENFNRLGWPVSIFLCIFSVFLFILNVFLFSYIINAIKFSNNSSLYEKASGTVTDATVKIWHEGAHGSKTDSNKFKTLIKYSFSVDGTAYFGVSQFESGVIDYAVRRIKKFLPDQIISLRILPYNKYKPVPSDIGEYKEFLKNMPFDFTPKQAHSSVRVTYEKQHPENHSLGFDTSTSSILFRVLWILAFSVMGSLFTGLLLFNVPSDFKHFGIGVLLFLTPIFPAFFIGSPFTQDEKNLQPEETNSNQVYYELVIDQNNSEAHLKEQLRQQKLKYQNELQQPQ